jgi:DNA-directed RNA polymerase specialized sigma24 family protein
MGEEMNTDMQLVTRAMAGDQDAYSEIFCANRERIYRLCCQMLHGPQDAEDLTQETFLTVFGKLEQFRGASRLSTWIYRIAINASLRRQGAAGEQAWRQSIRHPAQPYLAHDCLSSGRGVWGAISSRPCTETTA